MAIGTHYLIPIAGPSLEALALVPSERALTIGRHEGCDLLLPASADKVSRFHAQFTYVDGRWHVADLKSRWGTFLNGRQLPAEQPTQLHTGDLINIIPWTFSLSTTAVGRGLKLAAEEPHISTMIHTLSSGASGSRSKPLSDDLLALLLESAAGIHNASDERSLGRILLDTAARGTGLRNGALLRPLDAQGTFEVLASCSVSPDEAPAFSRTLIHAASSGDVAEFSSGGAAGDVAQSIAQMNVTSALCVPLMLGNTVAAYLYLDARQAGGRGFGSPRLHPHAAAFAAALGKISSLALANLKRLDMERRAALVEAELNAGAEAQRFILPKRTATLGAGGKFAYIGESKPGRYVGGDFFDVIELDEDRIAVALADVAGKGIPASVLMAAAQGYLHSALQQHRAESNLSAAAAALNQFVCPRCPDNKFLTIFLAVLDAKKRMLTYVDAGHGYGLVKIPGGGFAPLTAESSLPIGISGDTEFPATTLAFPPGSELLIVSDGIIEQPEAKSGSEGREQFDLEGVQQTLAGLPAGADPIRTLFDAVTTFAGTSNLADDATALLVRYASDDD